MPSSGASALRRAQAEPSGASGTSKRPGKHPGRGPDGATAPLARGLYLVATPIGNMADISERALDILARAAVVACEDTRTTGKLLVRHGIDSRLIPYHDHNASRARPKIMERLKNGDSVALVSDAGTPGISDPGLKLVQAAIAANIPVTAAPGPTAGITALILSGLPTDRFLFAGFLAAKRTARRADLAGLAAVPATLVFQESAKRLADSLADMVDTLGDRPAAVARELTKLHEELRRGSLAELAAHYAEAGPPKGEIVIVAGPPMAATPPDGDALDALIRERLKGASVRDTAAEIAAETGVPRRLVYTRAVALADERDGG